jgi:phosphatidylethanolamine-binding protein (PEBP) family uncharacterized protein
MLLGILACLGCDAFPSVLPSDFVLTSTAFEDGGTLPLVHTCDGAGSSPPLSWTGGPAGTLEYAVLMTTLANDGLK